jgi:hypothetical protein
MRIDRGIIGLIVYALALVAFTVITAGANTAIIFGDSTCFWAVGVANAELPAIDVVNRCIIGQTVDEIEATIAEVVNEECQGTCTVLVGPAGINDRRQYGGTAPEVARLMRKAWKRVKGQVDCALIVAPLPSTALPGELAYTERLAFEVGELRNPNPPERMAGWVATVPMAWADIAPDGTHPAGAGITIVGEALAAIIAEGCP